MSAISVGVVDGRVRLDLPYEEDSRAEVDMNVVATDTGTLIEVQGTGEGATFTRSTLDKMLDLAQTGCAELARKQSEALAEPSADRLAEGTADENGREREAHCGQGRALLLEQERQVEQEGRARGVVEDADGHQKGKSARRFRA